jgi:hypothetical protein
VVQQADLPSGFTPQVLPGGDQVTGQATLDFCSIEFPSETLRSARYQVAVYDSADQPLVSTEAVAYQTPTATAQVFAEASGAPTRCPTTFVPSRTPGDPPTKTVFGPAPDRAWPSVPGVERLAFDATRSDQQGHSDHEILVYLRRGRILVGLYFVQPFAPKAAIAGKTTMATIVAVFAARIANLQESETG